MANCINRRHAYNTRTTYDLFFYDDIIQTTVTHDPDTVSEWIMHVENLHCSLLHRLIVGLDIEWRPSFQRNLENRVATLQLCVANRCLIYQLLHSPCIPQPLAMFLSNANYTFVGVGVKSDLEKLYRHYNIELYSRVVELGELAAELSGMKDLKNAGLKNLLSFVVGKTLEKPRSVTMSNWNERWLTDDQVKYACLDAYASFDIGRIMNASEY